MKISISLVKVFPGSIEGHNTWFIVNLYIFRCNYTFAIDTFHEFTTYCTDDYFSASLKKNCVGVGSMHAIVLCSFELYSDRLFFFDREEKEKT